MITHAEAVALAAQADREPSYRLLMAQRYWLQTPLLRVREDYVRRLLSARDG